jgi:hypothetical protein
MNSKLSSGHAIVKKNLSSIMQGTSIQTGRNIRKGHYGLK